MSETMSDLIEQYLHSLQPSEISYINRVKKRSAIWTPASKKQWSALLSRADEIFYGGAAGGGKTDLVIGLAATCHQRSAIFRRVYPNLREIMRRSREILKDHANENKSDRVWTFPDGRTIEFGAVQYEKDKTNWQGRPHDLKAFDELPEFSLSQYLFISGWNRTTDPGQRVRIVGTGNPPTNEAGSWVIDRWAAWVKDDHPNPAKPGELRWFATVEGKDREFESGDPVKVGNETIHPRSRTFIPAFLEDNPYYAHDNRYRGVLQSLPEPLRSQLLYGDFLASAAPDPWQIIPTAWVKLAQERWLNAERPAGAALDAVGLDPIRGGNDYQAMARRYGTWFDEVKKWSGSKVTDGPSSVEMMRRELGREIPGYINIDVGGIGSSTYDYAKPKWDHVYPINFSSGSNYKDRSGKLKMRNIRAELYWRMRDALDPEHGDNICLPPGNEILADLCTARYKVTTAGVQVESKEEIKERIGRSPDVGEAVLLAMLPKRVGFGDLRNLGKVEGYKSRWA